MIIDVPPKWRVLPVVIVIVSIFIMGIAAGILVKSAHGAELAIPKLRSKHAIPLSIGKTSLPEEPRACTKQLKELKLCL